MVQSDVWDHFEKIFEGSKIVRAKCNYCGKVLQYSVSGQKSHVKRLHPNVNYKSTPSNNLPPPAINQPQPKITNFFPVVNHDTLSAYLARLAAKVGLPFKTIASDKIATLLKSHGFCSL